MVRRAETALGSLPCGCDGGAVWEFGDVVRVRRHGLKPWLLLIAGLFGGFGEVVGAVTR